MSNNLIIREATSEDAGAIGQLHNEVYMKVYGKESGSSPLWSTNSQCWWKWSNVDNPAKRSYSFIAEDAGKIIGHHGYRCIWLNVNGKKELAAISWGSITHPAYMRQGILRSLQKAGGTRARLGGVAVAYSHVTRLGRLALLSCGAKDLGTFNTLVKVINPGNFVRKKTGSKALAAISGVPLDLMLGLWAKGNGWRRQHANISIVEISLFDSRFDCLWAKLKGVVPLSTWRDSEYLNWRYVFHPTMKYKILAAKDGNTMLGYIVLSCIDTIYRVGYVADFLFLPGKEADASLLLDAAIDHLKAIGADIASFATFENSPYYRLFTSCGFMRRGQCDLWTVEKLAHTGTIDVFDVRNWYLTQGDRE